MLSVLALLLVLSPPGGPPTRVAEPDGQHGSVFGFATAVDDRFAVVGAPLDDARGSNSGAIFVYERLAPAGGSVQSVGPDWDLVAKITASDGYAGDQFGYAVALASGTILVGAPLDSCGPSEGHATECGAVYVIELGGAGGWTETKLLPADPTPWAWFGNALAVDGERLLVGAYGDSERAAGAGGAHLFERDAAGVWNEVGKLVAPDGATDDWLGWSVDLDGDLAVLGAYNSTGVGGQPGAGSGYVFERAASGTWTDGVELFASDGAPFDRMGRSVALMDGTALVASHRHDQSRGAVYVFEDVGGTWAQTAQLAAATAQVDSSFGTAITVRGDIALVSAPLQDSPAPASGTVFAFRRSASGWQELGAIEPFQDREDAYFGVSIAMSPTALLVGAPTPWDADGVGAVWLFDWP